MTTVFLSFCTSQDIWVQQFTKRNLIDKIFTQDGIPPKKFNSSVEKITVGQYISELQSQIDESDVFIAIIDEAYWARETPLREFEYAYDKFFENGNFRPGKVFSIIFLSEQGLLKFQQRAKEDKKKRPFHADFAYLTLFQENSPRFIFVKDMPDGPVNIELENHLKQILQKLRSHERAVPVVPPEPKIVLIGQWNKDLSAIGAEDELRESLDQRGFGRNALAELENGWEQREAGSLYMELRSGNTIFVHLVDITFASAIATTPELLPLILEGRKVLPSNIIQKLKDQPGSLIYWMRPSAACEVFNLKAQKWRSNHPGPRFFVGTADELINALEERLIQAKPAPPIRYDRAPDTIVERLRDTIKEALAGRFNPPTPDTQRIDPKNLKVELSAIAEARAGIFITSEITRAKDNDIPEDVKKRVLRYVDQIDEFTREKALNVDQIFRLVLVIKKGSMWSGKLQVMDDENRRLSGWRFLGVNVRDEGPSQIDEEKLAQIVDEVKLMI